MSITENLLLINKNIQEYSLFINSINEYTVQVTYDNDSDSISDILIKIQDLGIESFNYLAFVFNDNGTTKQYFGINEQFISTNHESIIPNTVTEFITNIVLTYNIQTIDFLACNLLSYSTWKDYFNFLINSNNIVVRASSNQTGNLNIGGDWILETTNEDIKHLYFTDVIGEWNYLLDSVNSRTNNIILDSNGNMYYVGVNTNGCFGNNSSGETVYTFTKNTIFTITPQKKVLQVLCGKDVSWLITNENNNNFYTCGINNNGMLGIDNSSLTDFRTSFSNKRADGTTSIFPEIKINSISMLASSLNANKYGALVSNEANNNLYVIGNYYTNINMPGTTRGNFLLPTKYINISSTAIQGKKIVSAVCGGTCDTSYFPALFALTNESTNNFYVHGSQASRQLGNNMDTGSALSWTNGCTNQLNGKTVLAIGNGTSVTTFVITNETTNNLYVAGSTYNSNNPPINKTGTNANQGLFTNTNFINNPFNSVRVLGVSSGLYSTLVWTDEQTNNLYFCGSNIDFNLGNNVLGATPATAIFSKNFKNNPAEMPFLNKRVIFAQAGNFSYVLTDETTNNFYSVGVIRPATTGNNYGLVTGRTKTSVAISTSAYIALQYFNNTFVN